MIDRDTIIKLAREAGGVPPPAERDACVDIVENADTPDCGGWTTQCIADRIRARNNHA